MGASMVRGASLGVSWGMRFRLLLMMAWLLPGCQCEPASNQVTPAPSASALPASALSASAPPAPPTSPPEAHPPQPRKPPPVPKSGLKPLAGPRRVDLKLSGARAVTQVPVGTTRAQPLLTVLGAGPAECEPWLKLLPKAFVLCLTGAEEAALRAQVKLAVGQLGERFGEHLGPRGALVGHGVGGLAAANLMRESPALFPRGILVDGGAEVFSGAVSRAFADAGGEAVLFVCADCPTEKAVTALRREGIAAGRADAFQITSAADWLTRGDPWWIGELPTSITP